MVTKSERERRTVLVTGACGDIGQAIAAALLAEGYIVVACDLMPPQVGRSLLGGRFADPIRDGALLYRQADVRDRLATRSLVASSPPVDIAIANAGIGRSAPILELTDEEWREHLDTNLSGAFNTAQAAAARMVAEQRPGLLLFTSSWIGSIPWPEMTAYATSKAGIEMMAKQFALELAPFNIRANVVAPGIVNAGMARKQIENDPQYAARAATSIPLKELQTPGQVADAVVFLCSDAARYMTGSKLTVDGGCSLYYRD